MQSGRPQLRRGRIIYASVRDRNGFAKNRPALILSRTEDVRADEPLVVMAITTTFPEPPPENCIVLPWHPKGHPETRLNRRIAAVLDWLDEVDVDQVLGFGGDVPARIMIHLLERLNES